MLESHTQKRLFIGIPLSVLFKDALLKVQERNQSIKKIRWTPPQNLHITLHFLGSTEEDEIGGIISSVQNITHETDPFTLVFDRYQLAPKKRPYMIWATFLRNSSFVQLFKAINSMFSSILPNSKEPHAHITLARFKYLERPYQIKLVSEVEMPTIQVNNIVLWESILKPEGAEYTAIQAFQLDKD
jgi:RNA 2',3'-cyclic 3'-phosphodiesterase